MIDDPELKDGLVNLKAVDGIKYGFYKNAIDFGSPAMIIEIITLANEHYWLKHQLLKAPVTEDGMTFFQYSGYIGAAELMEAILDIACMDTFEWVKQVLRVKSIPTNDSHQINPSLRGDSQFIYDSFLLNCLAEDDLSPEHREKAKKIKEDIIQIEY